jgi:hypothetical protein
MLRLQWNGYDAQHFRLRMSSNKGSRTVRNQQSVTLDLLSENTVLPCMYHGGFSTFNVVGHLIQHQLPREIDFIVKFPGLRVLNTYAAAIRR